jgi:hypothetical protein
MSDQRRPQYDYNKPSKTLPFVMPSRPPLDTTQANQQAMRDQKKEEVVPRDFASEHLRNSQGDKKAMKDANQAGSKTEDLGNSAPGKGKGKET